MSTEPAPKRKRGRPRKQPATATRPLTWRDLLLLGPGDTLRGSPRSTRGNLGQYETDVHEVINALGQTVGTVEYHASMSLKPPFKTSYRLVQMDSAGNVIVEVRW